MDIIDSGNLQISPDHIKEMKEFIDDALMWTHIHEKPTKAEYKQKIDSVNDVCDKIFNMYQNDGTQVFKENEIAKSNKNTRDELENLCIVIKLLIEDDKIPLDKDDLKPLLDMVKVTLDWIFKNDIAIEKAKNNKTQTSEEIEKIVDENTKIYHGECEIKLNLIISILS